MIKLVVFDLDGTLTESKQPLSPEIAELLCPLLKRYQVAIISGAGFERFEKQVLASLACPEELLANLSLFPLNGNSFYLFKESSWKNIYLDELTPEEKKTIFDAFRDALNEQDWKVTTEPYGELIEDRGAQITFSGLGQNAPLELKKEWDPDHSKRRPLAAALKKHLSDFEVNIAGTTSIDITKKGVDKAYGIKQIKKYLNLESDEILFIGDALFPEGNDSPVKTTGIKYRQVNGPATTRELINELLL